MSNKIDLKSIRIGNLFQDEISGKVIEVVGLKEEEIVFSGMFTGLWQAVPLKLSDVLLIGSGFQRTYKPDSPEWRISLGLGNGEELFVEYPYHQLVSVGVKRSKPLLPDSKEDWCYFKDIEYFHQLQNIFYDLSGKDLTLDKSRDIMKGYGVKTPEGE